MINEVYTRLTESKDVDLENTTFEELLSDVDNMYRVQRILKNNGINADDLDEGDYKAKGQFWYSIVLPILPGFHFIWLGFDKKGNFLKYEGDGKYTKIKRLKSPSELINAIKDYILVETAYRRLTRD